VSHHPAIDRADTRDPAQGFGSYGLNISTNRESISRRRTFYRTGYLLFPFFPLFEARAGNVLKRRRVGPTAPLALGLTWIHRESLPKAAYVNVFYLLDSYAYAMVTSAADKKPTLTA